MGRSLCPDLFGGERAIVATGVYRVPVAPVEFALDVGLGIIDPIGITIGTSALLLSAHD